MINIEKYASILEHGLLLDHYSLLCSIRGEEELPKSKRIQGFINLLTKKGYLLKGKLTSKAIELIENDRVISDVIKSPTLVTKGLLKTPVITDDYLQWAKTLHEKLQDKLFEKTGKRQARGNINGATYSFLPNVNDFCKILLKVIVAYKLKDFDKIDKCLMRFLERKIKENNYFPILGYYMMKNNTSTMVTEMDNIEEESSDNQASTFII